MSEEKEIPWGLVVESDQVYSEAKDRWYTIERIERAGGKVKAKAEGVPTSWLVRPAKPVRVKRGATGQAVDVLQIVFSGEM